MAKCVHMYVQMKKGGGGGGGGVRGQCEPCFKQADDL